MCPTGDRRPGDPVELAEVFDDGRGVVRYRGGQRGVDLPGPDDVGGQASTFDESPGLFRSGVTQRGSAVVGYFPGSSAAGLAVEAVLDAGADVGWGYRRWWCDYSPPPVQRVIRSASRVLAVASGDTSWSASGGQR